MLETPTREQQNALRVADRIENLRAGRFNMNSWLTCIKGQTEQMGLSVEDLGVTTPEQRQELLQPSFISLAHAPNEDVQESARQRARDKQLAASVLRHFALTGEVDWARAERAHGYVPGEQLRVELGLPRWKVAE